jgi:hypothetical protein
MHTIKVIAGGFALLALCLSVGRLIGGPSQAAALATAAKVFVPIWLAAAGVNMWIGVSPPPTAGISPPPATPMPLS